MHHSQILNGASVLPDPRVDRMSGFFSHEISRQSDLTVQVNQGALA